MIVDGIIVVIMFTAANIFIAFFATFFTYPLYTAYLVIKHKIPDKTIDLFTDPKQVFVSGAYLKRVKRERKSLFRVRASLLTALVIYTSIFILPFIYACLISIVEKSITAFVVGFPPSFINLLGLYLTFHYSRKILILER